MAEPFNPKLQTPGYKGYEAPPIVDKSEALASKALFDAVSGLTSAVTTGVEQYQKEKAIEGLNENVGSLIKEQQERSLQGQLSLEDEANASKQQINQTYQDMGYDSTYPTMLNQELTDRTQALQENLAEKTEKLARAKEQGIMKEAEFRERFNKVIREAISANPSYGNEIIAHAKKVADVYDVSYKVKQDEAALKDIQESESKKLDNMLKSFEKAGVPIYSNKYKLANGQDNIEAMRADYERLLTADTTRKFLEDQSNIEKIRKNNSVQLLIDNNVHYQLKDSSLTNLDLDLTNIVNSDKSPDEKMTLINNTINDMVSTADRYLSQLGATGNEAVEKMRTELKSDAEKMRSIYDKIVVKGYSKEALSNEIDLIVKSEESKIYRAHPDLLTSKVLTEILQGLPERLAYPIKTEYFKKIVDSQSVSTNSLGDPEYQEQNDTYFKPLKDVKGKGPYMVAFDNIIKLYNEGDPSATAEAVDKKLNGVLNYIDSPNPINGPMAIRDLMNTLGDPNSKQAIDNLNPDTLSRVSTLVGQYTKPLANAYQDFVTNYPDAELKVMPDSGKMIINNLTNEYKQFNSNGLRSINEAFKAYHAVSGNSSVAKSADEFYGTIQQQSPNNTGEPTEKK